MDETSGDPSVVTPQDWIYAFIYLRGVMASKKHAPSSPKGLKGTASPVAPRRSARLKTSQETGLATAPDILPSPPPPKPNKTSPKHPKKAKPASKGASLRETPAKRAIKSSDQATKRVRLEDEAARTTTPTQVQGHQTVGGAQEHITSVDPPPARTKPRRPFYSYVRAWNGHLVPIEKRLSREPDHTGPPPALDPDHWPQVAKYRWLTFLSIVAPYDLDTEIQAAPNRHGLKAMAPSREWWLSRPVSLLRYWVDIMGVFSYLDGLELELGGFVEGNILKEPETVEEFVDGMERMRVRLMMYNLPVGEGRWEVADNGRPYIFLPRELHSKFMDALITDLESHGFAVVST